MRQLKKRIQKNRSIKTVHDLTIIEKNEIYELKMSKTYTIDMLREHCQKQFNIDKMPSKSWIKQLKHNQEDKRTWGKDG